MTTTAPSPITHPDLRPLRHGFFTREGGVSTGIYRSLNGGRGSADDQALVAQNRARVATAMGVGPECLAGVHQVHSAKVVTIRSPAEIEAARSTQADALVTDQPGIALSILTADCQPVLLADAEAGVIGAAHAGWRGALAGVLQETVRAMTALGARNVRAVIGPCISVASYEVGDAFMDDALAEDPDLERFFTGGPNGPHFDLPGYGLSCLREAGAEASWTGHCTYRDAERFFSYRRATHEGAPDYGRLISAIVL